MKKQAGKFIFRQPISSNKMVYFFTKTTPSSPNNLNSEYSQGITNSPAVLITPKLQSTSTFARPLDVNSSASSNLQGTTSSPFSLM